MEDTETQELPNKTGEKEPNAFPASMLSEPTPEQMREWERQAAAPAKRDQFFDMDEKIHPARCQKHGSFEQTSYVFAGERHYTTCPACSEEKKEREEREAEASKKAQDVERRMSSSGIPERFKDATFDNYRIDQGEQQRKVFQACRQYAIAYPERWRLGTSLMLVGGVGVGKTHLAVAIAKEAMREGSVLYTTCLKATRKVKESFSRESKTTESQALQSFVSPGLLIVDEVGVQYGSVTEHNIIFEIINDRYESNRPTILISNLDFEAFTQMVGDRVIDRLSENGGRALTFDWKSHRAKK